VAITHNGQVVTHDILLEKWKTGSVCGDTTIEKIPYCIYLYIHILLLGYKYKTFH